MSKASAPAVRAVATEIGFSDVLPAYGILDDFPMLSWTRKTDCVWEEIETPPGSGTYDWAEMDEEYAAAAQNGYGIVFVLKTGNENGVVDQACHDAVVASHQSVYTRLYSCPILSTYETHWKNFVRAAIRRFGFGPVAVGIQIETDSGDKQRWNYDLESEGEQAATSYLTILRLAYEAKTAERWTGDIILTGLIDLDRAQVCTNDPASPRCNTPAETRNRAFTSAILASPDNFDAIDIHYAGYTYFMPYSLPMALAWLTGEAKRNGWDLREKKLFMLEWVPSFVANLPDANAVEAVAQYFPYEEDFVASPYLDDPIVIDADGVPQENEPAPCSFHGDYDGVNEKVVGVAVRQAGVDSVPQQFYYTTRYLGDGIDGGLTTWSGPENITIEPFLIGNGVYVQWQTRLSGRLNPKPIPVFIPAPVGCGALAHPPDPDAAVLAALHLYANLDFAELPPPDGTNADSKYRRWFEQEESIAFVKDFCIARSLGIERFIHVNFADYFPRLYPVAGLALRWHGMIRLYDYLLDTPTFIRKPSWYCLQTLVDDVIGFEKVEGFTFDAGVVAYKFTFPNSDGRDPVYIAWARVDGVPNYRYSATPEVLEVLPIAVAFADFLGEEFASCFTFVTALDEDDEPIVPVTLLAGTETIDVGLIPILIKPFTNPPVEVGPAPGDDSFLLQDNFNGGIASWWTGYALGHYDQNPRETPASSDSLAFVDAAWGGGAKAAQFTVVPGDYVYRGDLLSTKERAELIWTPTPAAVHIGDLAYYEWSVYIPSAYSYNSDVGGGIFQIMGQWHDNGAGLGYQPPVNVTYQQTAGGQSRFHFLYGLNEIGQTRQSFDHNINRGQKYVLRFHFRWATDATGYLEVYVDDVLVKTFTGANVYPSQGENPNVFRLGIYRGQNQLANSVFQIGELSISSDPL